MNRLRNFVRKFPLPVFFTLAFVISWSCVLAVIGGPGRVLVPNEEALVLVPQAILAMLAGPCAAGVLVAALVFGREGLQDMFSRLRIWRVGPGWYALALLTAPVVATSILLVLLQFSPQYLPAAASAENRASFVMSGLTAGLVVGLFEEIGWTGFALPVLRRRFGVLRSGLILGFLWGAWHYILALWGSGTAEGALVWGRFLPEMLFYVAVLPVYRVLMAWLYENSGSLLLAVLMHAVLTGLVPNILMPPDITSAGLAAWYLLFTAALWLIAGAAVWANGGCLHAMEPETQGI